MMRRSISRSVSPLAQRQLFALNLPCTHCVSLFLFSAFLLQPFTVDLVYCLLKPVKLLLDNTSVPIGEIARFNDALDTFLVDPPAGDPIRAVEATTRGGILAVATVVGLNYHVIDEAKAFMEANYLKNIMQCLNCLPSNYFPISYGDPPPAALDLPFDVSAHAHTNCFRLACYSG